MMDGCQKSAKLYCFNDLVFLAPDKESAPAVLSSRNIG